MLRDLLGKARRDDLEISPQEARDRILRGLDLVLLDVRGREEIHSGHLPGAQFLSLGRLRSQAHELLPSPDKPIVTYCASGTRSLQGARILLGLGYHHVSSMAGGIKRWNELGYPTEKPENL